MTTPSADERNGKGSTTLAERATQLLVARALRDLGVISADAEANHHGGTEDVALVPSSGE